MIQCIAWTVGVAFLQQPRIFLLRSETIIWLDDFQNIGSELENILKRVSLKNLPRFKEICIHIHTDNPLHIDFLTYVSIILPWKSWCLITSPYLLYGGAELHSPVLVFRFVLKANDEYLTRSKVPLEVQSFFYF